MVKEDILKLIKNAAQDQVKMSEVYAGLNMSIDYLKDNNYELYNALQEFTNNQLLTYFLSAVAIVHDSRKNQ